MKGLERAFAYVAAVLAVLYTVSWFLSFFGDPSKVEQDILWLTAAVWFLLFRDARRNEAER